MPACQQSCNLAAHQSAVRCASTAAAIWYDDAMAGMRHEADDSTTSFPVSETARCVAVSQTIEQHVETNCDMMP